MTSAVSVIGARDGARGASRNDGQVRWPARAAVRTDLNRRDARETKTGTRGAARASDRARDAWADACINARRSSVSVMRCDGLNVETARARRRRRDGPISAPRARP